MATYTLRFEQAPDLNNNADTSTIQLWLDGINLGTKTSAPASSGWPGYAWTAQAIDVSTIVKSTQPMPLHTLEWRYSSGQDGSRLRNVRIESSDGVTVHDQFGGTIPGGHQWVASDGGGAPAQIDTADATFKQSGTLNAIHRFDCTNLLSAGDKPGFSLVCEIRGDNSTSQGNTIVGGTWRGSSLATREALQCWTWDQWNDELHWMPRAWNLDGFASPPGGAQWWGYADLGYSSGSDGSNFRRVRIYDWSAGAYVNCDVLAFGGLENPDARLAAGNTSMNRVEPNESWALTEANNGKYPAVRYTGRWARFWFADGYAHRWFAFVDIAPDQNTAGDTNDSEWRLSGVVVGQRRSLPATSSTVRQWRTIAFEVTGLLDETPTLGTENPFEGRYVAGGDAVGVRNVFARGNGDELITQYDPALWLDLMTASLSTGASMTDCTDTASTLTATGTAWATYYLGGECAGGADLTAFVLVFDLSPDPVTTGSSNDYTKIGMTFNGTALADAVAGPETGNDTFDWQEIRRNIGHLWAGDGTDHLQWRFFSLPHGAPYNDTGHIRHVRVEDDLGNIVSLDQYADEWWGRNEATGSSGTNEAQTAFRNSQANVCYGEPGSGTVESADDWNDHYFPGDRCSAGDGLRTGRVSIGPGSGVG